MFFTEDVPAPDALVPLIRWSLKQMEEGDSHYGLMIFGYACLLRVHYWKIVQFSFEGHMENFCSSFGVSEDGHCSKRSIHWLS